jgi:DNA polymerase V
MSGKKRVGLADCNNFFCSCERVFDPSLEGKPVVVLSNNDGCIISRSDEAKALGIPMGAPLHEQEAVIRKQGGRILSSNYTLYGDMSARVMSILRDAVPSMEIYSIDEAFLEIPPTFVMEDAKALRMRILRWTGIPVRIGIGETKLLAKLANRLCKKLPKSDGGVLDLTLLPDRDALLEATPCGDLWGVGKGLAERLAGLGVKNALEFRDADPVMVRMALGVTGERLGRELAGVPCLDLEEMPPDRKGVTATRSFGRAVESLEILEEALANHVFRVAERIRRHGLLATHVEVILRTNRFRPQDPQHRASLVMTLDHPTGMTSKLMEVARDLLRRMHRPGYLYKKTGVVLGDLIPESSWQPSLFPVKSAGRNGIDIDRIVDDINRRLGDPRSPVITRGAMGSVASSGSWRMRSNLRSRNYTTSWPELPEAKS